MRTAEQSELQQENTHSLTASHSYANSIQQPGADILTPLASRSLFWRARYLENSPTLCHIPLLFWLTEAARPRIAVTLGVTDAVPHFAVCQAVDKLGMESLCVGVEPAPEPDAKPADLSKQHDFNETNFAEFSQIVQEAPGKDSFLAAENKVDLLLINRPITQKLIETLDTHWLPHLSERSIIVVLHDGETAGNGSLFRHLSAAGSSFTCDLESRATVIFHGPEQNDRLQRLASLKPGLPGYLTARNIFARLGELHRNAERLAFNTREAAIARRQRDEKAAELATAQAETEKLSVQYKERSLLVATAQAEAFDLSQAVTKLEQELEELQAKHQQETELLNKQLATLQEKLSAAEAKQQDLQKLAAEQEGSLAERDTVIASLESKLQAQAAEMQTISEERDTLQKERDLLSTQNSALEATVDTAENELQKLRELAAEQENTLAERYKDISVLGNELQAKEEKIQAITGERDNLRQEKDIFNSEVAALKNKLRSAEAERQKLQKLAAEQENTLAERYKDISVLGNELQAKTEEACNASEEREAMRQEIEALKHKLSETEQLRDMYAERVQALEHSTSWRVTAPLRKVSLAVRPQ